MPELKVVSKQEVIKCEVSEFRKDEEQKHYRYKMEWGGAQKENMDSEENTGTYRVEMRKSKKSETKVK